MSRYYDCYDEVGERRSILTRECFKKGLKLSLEFEVDEEERFRRQAEAVLASEEAMWRERDARIARGEVDEMGRPLK